MWRQLLQRYRQSLVLPLVLGLPWLSMYFHGKDHTTTTWLERALMAMTAPGQRAAPQRLRGGGRPRHASVRVEHQGRSRWRAGVHTVPSASQRVGAKGSACGKRNIWLCCGSWSIQNLFDMIQSCKKHKIDNP